MKKYISLLLYAACSLAVLLPMACGSNPSSPTQAQSPSGPTINATSSDTFSPSTVTITHGSTVNFLNNSGITHTLVIDNGSGTCAQSYTTWPQVISFPTAGTFSFHCTIHSSCNTSTCTGCTGMVGTVVVQ